MDAISIELVSSAHFQVPQEEIGYFSDQLICFLLMTTVQFLVLQ